MVTYAYKFYDLNFTLIDYSIRVYSGSKMICSILIFFYDLLLI